MAVVIRMPRLSDTMEEGNIVGWQKKVGDKVKPGDVLAEVETDKATMDLENYHDGYLLHIGVPSGPVKVNGILAVIGEKGEDFSSLLGDDSAGSNDQKPSEASTPPSEEKAAESDTSKQETKPVEPAEQPKADSGDDNDNKRIKASPLAKSIASASNVDLSQVEGSGDQGRIVKKDIEQYLTKGSEQQPAQAYKKPEESTSVAASYIDVPLTQMRKTIAKRLGESKFSAPHFYLTIEIDMDRAIETRKQLNVLSDTKISFNDLVIKSVASALRQHPAINSSWLGDRIRINNDINIGVAVAVEDGLVVPVVRHANTKSLSQINAEVKEYAQKAKDKKLQPAEMQGNTFTISNLGMFDIDEFTAIINSPDACILAVGSIVQKPVVKNGEIVVGNTMKVTLSCDHRVVDGATGAKFLQSLKSIVEDPIRMLI